MKKLDLKTRLKILATGTFDDHRIQFLSGEELADAPISGDAAMKYSAVNACVRVLSETFASVPILLYKKTTDGREPVVNDIYDILHNKPNEEMAPFNFNETLMTNFCIGGNAVCERLVNSSGKLVGLYPYASGITQIKRDKETGKLIYEIGGNAGKKLSREQVLHIPNMSFDGVVGVSPITYAAETIRLGMSYETYGVNFYKNGATPSGVLQHPESLSDEAFSHLKEDLKKNYAGLKNAGTPMILEEGMTWVGLTFSPVDSQLLESKYFQIEDICRIFRVPQHLINKLDRSTYSNIEHQSLEFVMYTMLPIFKRYEDNINMQLLTTKDRKDGLYFEYKIDGLLRGDTITRAKAYTAGRQWGWLSVNDIRKLENLPPIENGDRYLEPLNFKEAGDVDETTEDIANMISERR